MNNDSHIGVCFLGSEDQQADDMTNDAFKSWLNSTLYKLIESEYCTRVIFRRFKVFEIACLKTILGRLFLEPRIVEKIETAGGVDLLLIVADDGTVAQDSDIEAGQSLVNDLFSIPLKFPLSLSPFPVPGGEKDKICEMIDLSDFMVCSLPPNGSEMDRFYHEYAQGSGVAVINWFDSLSDETSDNG